MAWDKYLLEGMKTGAEFSARRREQEAQQAFEKWKMERQSDPEYILNQIAPTLAMLGQGDKIPELAQKFKEYKEQRTIPQLTEASESFGGGLPEMQPGIMPPLSGLGITGANLGKNGMSLQFGKTPYNKLTEEYYQMQLKDKYKQTSEAEKTVTGTKRFLQQFGRSYNELRKAYPNFDREGGWGWVTRRRAEVANIFDKHPETGAFLKELDPLANQMARDIEGGRITDEDRAIYAKSFANTIKNPSQTNIRLVSNKLLGLRDKGADISGVLNDLESSGIDIMQAIAREVKADSTQKNNKNKYSTLWE